MPAGSSTNSQQLVRAAPTSAGLNSVGPDSRMWPFDRYSARVKPKCGKCDVRLRMTPVARSISMASPNVLERNSTRLLSREKSARSPNPVSFRMCGGRFWSGGTTPAGAAGGGCWPAAIRGTHRTPSATRVRTRTTMTERMRKCRTRRARDDQRHTGDTASPRALICTHADALPLPNDAACGAVVLAGLAIAGAVERRSRFAPPNSRLPAARPNDDRWWKREPIRFLQTNLSENDSTVDPKALVAAVADFGANTFLMNMGGIVAQYPTRVPFHYPSTFLPPGRDLFGDVVREAHARKIRVVGRFDLSKTQQPVFDAHPEVVLRARERRAGHLQRPLLDLHQRQLLPRACADDPDGGARSLRGRRAVLQHVRQPVDRLQRRGDRPLPLPGMPDPLSRPVQPSCAGRRRCGLSILHGRLVARGRRDDCRADSPQAPECRLPHLHQGPHRRHHVRVEHRGRPSAADVAVLGERQREPIARVRAGQGGDQPGDELHRFSVALRARAAGRDRAAPVSEPRARRAAGRRRVGTDAAAGSQRPARGKADLRLARAARGSLPGHEQRRAACCCSPPGTPRPTAASSDC